MNSLFPRKRRFGFDWMSWTRSLCPFLSVSGCRCLLGSRFLLRSRSPFECQFLCWCLLGSRCPFECRFLLACRCPFESRSPFEYRCLLGSRSPFECWFLSGSRSPFECRFLLVSRSPFECWFLLVSPFPFLSVTKFEFLCPSEKRLRFSYWFEKESVSRFPFPSGSTSS